MLRKRRVLNEYGVLTENLPKTFGLNGAAFAVRTAGRDWPNGLRAPSSVACDCINMQMINTDDQRSDANDQCRRSSAHLSSDGDTSASDSDGSSGGSRISAARTGTGLAAVNAN